MTTSSSEQPGQFQPNLAQNKISLCKGVQVTNLERKHHSSILIWNQGTKRKFQFLLPNHILEYQLCSPENVDVVQVTNFKEKRKRRISTLIWPLGIKWKFLNFTRHTHILGYRLFTLWEVDGASVTTISPETSFFGP